VEACEYKRHFLHLDLDYAIITSLELDHTDYYKDQKDYDSAFVQLINKVKQNIFVPDNLKLSKFFDTKKIIKTKI
jgi:UDP-N-acetylmuramate--alanine ligase